MKQWGYGLISMVVGGKNDKSEQRDTLRIIAFVEPGKKTLRGICFRNANTKRL